MFVDVLPLIVKPAEAELLLRLSEKDLSAAELSKLLKLPLASVKLHVDSLFVKGFLRKVKSGETRYSVKPFSSVVSRYLGEGRTDAFGKFVVALADYRLEEHVKRARADPYPEGKVLPVPEAVFEPVTVVLPYETAVNVLEKADSISLRNCECRLTYKNCDKPLKTCLAIGDFSDELVERGVAEEIPFEEARKVLQLANEHGLVHQALYTDWLKGEVFDICSCCPCCCMYLRTFLNFGVRHHIAKSGFVAMVDLDKCTGCGVCLERCVFHARKLEDGKSVVVEENCQGCGLCTTTCSAGASRLVYSVKSKI
jgi:NAD-dependent dihydropyrimidine dehydrogenase PreA subunit